MKSIGPKLQEEQTSSVTQSLKPEELKKLKSDLLRETNALKNYQSTLTINSGDTKKLPKS